MTGLDTIELALDGLGWHPAAWRLAGDAAGGASDPRAWVEVARAADVAGFDVLHLEDTFGPPGQGRRDRASDRPEATLLAARIAPVTRRIGIVPTIVSTHTEPFHHAKAIATLDYVSRGRAGVRVRVSPWAADAALVGRREIADPVLSLGPNREAQSRELFDEAADYVEVLRRLWDSWEDDAVIRDTDTGRFVDRDKLHYIDFSGRWFTVRGPLITPRPPQGQPPVVVLAHAPWVYRFAAHSADVVHVTPRDRAELTRILGEVRAAETQAGRTGEPLRVVADVAVTVAKTSAEARSRAELLDELAGEETAGDASLFTGSADELVDLVHDWAGEPIDGVRFRPQSRRHDLPVLADLLPRLPRTPGRPRDGSLRSAYRLERPPSRYARSRAGASDQTVQEAR